MNWLKRLFLKWSGHKCPVCTQDHWDVGYEKWLEDPEWQKLIAEQFDKDGNLLPYELTPGYLDKRKQADERWRARVEKQRQDELIRRTIAKFNKPL